MIHIDPNTKGFRWKRYAEIMAPVAIGNLGACTNAFIAALRANLYLCWRAPRELK